MDCNYPNNKILLEPARQIPIAGEFDVVVCGGGPAGVAAAIAAGRNGAKTIILESNKYAAQASMILEAEIILLRE